MTKQMKVLLTGAAGFLGSHLCECLLERGHSVIGLDNFITGARENLAKIIEDPNFTLIEQDVSDFIDVPVKLDAVLHFASPASPNPASPYGYPNLQIQTMKAGALGTHNCLGISRRDKATFLLASTSEIYGDPLEHPQKETYWGHVDPVGPRSMYDESKRFAEALTMSYHVVHKLDTRIARIFNTFGPRMRLDDGRAVPNMINQAINQLPLTVHGDGSQTRSFCYVEDLIEGIYRLLVSPYSDPINLGNDAEISILELAQTINQITGNPAGIEYLPEKRFGNDPQRRRPDLTRARKLLHWEPKIDLQTGLRKTIEYYLQISC